MGYTPPLSENARGLELLQSMWIEFAITTFVIAARVYTRWFLVGKTNWDDLWMIVAFLVTLGSFILNNLAVNVGFGVPTADLDPYLAMEAVKWSFLGQVLGIMGSAFARMAFIATIICLLSPSQRAQLWMLRVFFVLQLCYNSMTALYILLQCHPTYGLWNPTAGAKCLPPYIQERIGYSQGAVNSFSDLVLAVLPATVIWKLNMKTSIKVSLCATMGLGVFAFATAVIKTVNLKEISADPTNLTYTMFGIQFWFCIENTTLIISATIPTLRPLISRTRGGQPTTANSMSMPSGTYPHGQGTWNPIEDPAGASSMDSYSDDVELTGKSKLGSGTDTECIATAEGDGRRPQQPGIVKTVNAYVTY